MTGARERERERVGAPSKKDKKERKKEKRKENRDKKEQGRIEDRKESFGLFASVSPLKKSPSHIRTLSVTRQTPSVNVIKLFFSSSPMLRKNELECWSLPCFLAKSKILQNVCLCSCNKVLLSEIAHKF